MHRSDVVVIGAGLAGLQCARRLAHRGARVVLVDRKASVTDAIQTTGIFVRKTWEDFPIRGEQLGPPIREVTLYSPAGRPLRLVAGHDEFRVGRMPWIYIDMLEQCVRAGVRWMPATKFVSAERSTFTVERGRHTERISARFAVGADGPRSRVARTFGLDRNSEFLVGLEDVVPSRGGSPALHCFLDPRLAPGYIAWLVDDGTEAHIGLAGYRGRFDPVASLARFRERFRHGRALERRGGLIPVNGILRRIANTHALLVGDAAGAVSPLTAGGLDAAMRLSAFAANVVAEFLDSGDPAVLQRYSGERFRARFVARRWMRRAMAAVSHPLTMELACAMLRLPLMRAVAEHVFFARGSFPDIPLHSTTDNRQPATT
ncbi:MAG TPA: NAD(P)/FAD-dependent oxidoreductase [Thermoanaerobaculia bacterium]